MTPLRGKILVEILSEPETVSGLYIHRKKDIPHRGRVIKIGKPALNRKLKEIKLNIAENEIVHFKRQWENTKKDGEKSFLVIKQDDVIAVESEGKLRATRDEVLIKRVFTGKIEHSTIIIPELAETKSNSMDYYGEVLSVGPEDKLGVNVGDRLVYQRNEGLRVELPNDRSEYFVLKPRAILATLENV